MFQHGWGLPPKNMDWNPRWGKGTREDGTHSGEVGDIDWGESKVEKMEPTDKFNFKKKT